MSKITDDAMQPCSIVVVSPFDVAQTETEHKELDPVDTILAT